MHSIISELGIKTLSSGLDCYDRMLCDGIPVGVISVDCGATTCYKTLLNLQKAFSFIKQTNSDVIYVDTEGGLLLILAGWKERFEKRFKLNKVNVIEAVFNQKKTSWSLNKELVDNGNLIVITVRDIFKLFAIHGTPLGFKISEKGKIDIIRKPYSYQDGSNVKTTDEELPIEETPIGKLINSIKCTGIIYDSLIELFKQRIPGTRENFGGRSFLLHSLLGSMQRIAETFKIPAIGIVHTSRDPTDRMKIREIPNAVSTISFNSKIMTLLQNPFFKNPMNIQIFRKLNMRTLNIWRHPYKAPLSEKYIIELTDLGLVEYKENKEETE